jgi:hypothetical protein
LSTLFIYLEQQHFKTRGEISIYPIINWEDHPIATRVTDNWQSHKGLTPATSLPKKEMLCQPCSAIFVREAFPGFNNPAAHHGTGNSLLQAAEDGCYVCSFFWRVLSEDGRKILLNEPRAASVTTFEISKQDISGKDGTALQLTLKFDPAFFEFPNFVVAFGIVPGKPCLHVCDCLPT